ncbi:DUF86 domain-containing protein [Candidatus Pacearchaeota archaeon]|nr:DUF86 domain-containing protein [Candidatus Pacearchaeota archaeon]HLC73151.1 DUF86 domain-containing protein [Candidatus Nanoarchaeia archaeon]
MRDYKLYLDDIIESIDKIDRYVKGLDYKSFVSKEILIDAVLRNLEIIGEAVKNIPSNVREKYPNIEWNKIAGFRDIVTHAYFGIDEEIVWDIIKNKLFPLKKEVEKIK